MKTTLNAEQLHTAYAQLAEFNGRLNEHYPGDGGNRQPVHTVYGGAHLFKAEVANKLGALALRTLNSYAPDFLSFAKALDLQWTEHISEEQEAALLADISTTEIFQTGQSPAYLAATVYERVINKLKREAVEDFRIDFEDGFGHRPDEEEDEVAVRAASEVARGMESGCLPPFIGIRVKPVTEELKNRSIRTTDIFLTTLLEASGGQLPNNFAITLPKITSPEQVAVYSEVLHHIESGLGLKEGAVPIELMIETTQSIIDRAGNCTIPSLVRAAGGRCRGAHFGTYDYTATCNITAAFQSHKHDACDFARHMMQVSLAGSNVWLSDGATVIMPVAPHRAPKEGPPLSDREVAENLTVISRAWKIHYEDVVHSLEHAFYQGWDLHPAQLPTRYAAVYTFFLSSLEDATQRLTNFVNKAAQATLHGDTFDDAATGQGLLNFFLRGMSCGAITETEALNTGLDVDDFRSRSFVKILDRKRQES